MKVSRQKFEDKNANNKHRPITICEIKNANNKHWRPITDKEQRHEQVGDYDFVSETQGCSIQFREY